MSECLFPGASPRWRERRRAPAPETGQTWRAFSRRMCADGAVCAGLKPLGALAVAQPRHAAG